MKLEDIRVATPCRADWNDMVGDDRVRFCCTCAKQVFNLSELTLAEAEALIADKHGGLCGRYYQRADGTILLADCTVGGSGARARSFVLATALAAGAAYAELHRGAPPPAPPHDDVFVVSGSVSVTDQLAPPEAATRDATPAPQGTLGR